MVLGKIVENTPFVKVTVGYGTSVQKPVAILDTGFTGDLQVSPTIADQLELEPIGVARAKVAGGQSIKVMSAMAVAKMEEETRVIEVLISEGMPMIGMSFLSKFGYEARINYKNKKVVLEMV